MSKRPKRMRISEENLHISAFAMVGDSRGSILLVRAGSSHPLSFRRGKLLLPASMLQFGERPMAAAKRALTAQLDGADALEPEFREIQSYIGSHWDLCFVYDADGRNAPKLSAKSPYTDASYYRLDALPRDAIAEDHLEIIDGQTAPKER
ncbi:MAG: NUDIX hydrolase [Thaumarchaeota archaeon]|nr:NUDIX hydrolase [Nitrososphaerota archaeon]